MNQVAGPDVVVRHEPSCCTGCGSDLSGATEVHCSRRQVFDIPPIKVHVTEHQIISRRCHCGKTSTGDVPAQAPAPVQYGPVMCAVILYLFMGQFLSKKRTAQAISELFGIPLSDGTVATVTSRAAGDLTEFLTQVTARLKGSAVVHFARNRTALRRPQPLAALRVHPGLDQTVLPPQTRHRSDGKDEHPARLHRHRRPRRVGPL